MVGEEPVRRERQVAVAAAQVDDPQRVVGRRGAQPVAGVGDGGVEDPHELLDLAVLRLPARLDPTLLVSQPEGREHGVVGRQQPLLLPVVRPLCGDRLRPCRRVGDRVELLGHPQLVHLGRGLDVPVAERLREQRIDGLACGVADQVVGDMGLGCVVRRHLEVSYGLQVHPPQLDPAPLRLLPLLPARRQPAHEGVRVEDEVADPAETVGSDSVTLVMTGSFDDGGHDDDHQQRRQRDRNDESTVARVHPPILCASSSARCRAWTPSRSSSWSAQDRPSARTTVAGQRRAPCARPAAGGTRRPPPRSRSAPSRRPSCRPARSSPAPRSPSRPPAPAAPDPPPSRGPTRGGSAAGRRR